MPGDAKDPTTIFPGKEEPPARILLFRHGAAEGSGDGRFISRTDNHLSAEGEAQVRAAAARARPWLEEALADGGDVTAHASPLLRARESAEILCRELKLAAPRIVDDLIELDLGRWEGESYDSLMEKEPERLRAHYADFVRSRAPEGESVMDLARRVRPVLRRIREANVGGTAIVAAHAAVNRVIVLDALGAPLRNFFRIELGFASLCVVDYHGDAPLVHLING